MSSKPSSHPVKGYQKGLATAWLLLLVVVLVSCGREGKVEKATAVRPQVPDVELAVTTWKVGANLVVWLNEEPLGILQGPLSWVKASDRPLREGDNKVRIAGASLQDMSPDQLPCALVIKGQSTPVSLTSSGPQEWTGGFTLRPEEWKPSVAQGVLESGSVARLQAWGLSMVEALRNKDGSRLRAMVEGFAEMKDADLSPFLMPTTPQVTFAVTSSDQLEVYQGPSMVLVTARPDPQTGAVRALIEAKADKAEWTMKQMLILRGKDGLFYLDTGKGWKRILTLQP